MRMDKNKHQHQHFDFPIFPNELKLANKLYGEEKNNYKIINETVNESFRFLLDSANNLKLEIRWNQSEELIRD